MAVLKRWLKPMDNDVLTVELDSIAIDGVKCDKNLKMEDPVANCSTNVSITNNLNHQVVTSAHISLTNHTLDPNVDGEKPPWVGSVCADTMKIKSWQQERKYRVCKKSFNK
mgnify:CR=1 FL=1